MTLQYYSDILGIFLKQALVECSSNILREYWNLAKDKHLLLSNQYTFNTKAT